MAVKAIVNKETLVFLRENIGISYEHIFKSTKFTEEKIRSWEDSTNSALPTCNQAKTIAKCFRVPFAGLYMNADDINLKHIPKMFNMRTLQSTIEFDDSSLNIALIDLLNTRDLLIDAKKELGEKTSPFTISIDSDDVKSCANVIREVFQLDLHEQYGLSSRRKFYLYVRDKVEQKGIVVQSFTGVDIETARGVAIYNDTFPIIGINDADRYPAKTFSIIHELVHICKRSSTMCNDMVNSFSAMQEEVFCNAIAGEVLVPQDAINILLNEHDIKDFTGEIIESLSNTFSVSKEVIIRRLLDLGRINKVQYDTFALEFKKAFDLEREVEKERRKAKGSTGIPRNIAKETIDKTSSNLCRTLYHGVGEGVINRQDVARYLRIDQKHVAKFLWEVSRWSS